VNVPLWAGDPDLDSSTPFNFWDALTPIEQKALTSVATQHTFPRDATIFYEGEPADHVVVIRSGWTKICVHKNGRERLLAERGPGQLVGERASLQPSVRSATVIALDTVDALVVRTQVFAGFISAHPRTLAIVENQVYHRLTRESGQHPHDGHPAMPTTGPTSASSAWDSPAERPPRLNGHNCTIVMTDIAEFNAPIRTADDRMHIQHKSLTMTHDALVQAGIPWDACHRRDQGDGLLVVVPPTIPPATVIKALALLATDLKSYNRRSAHSVQIRLKVAVHVGPVTTSESGLTGEALILAARLLDSTKLKRSMTEIGALLGVIASNSIYDTVIKDLDVEGYLKVRCKVKESTLVGWMQLTGRALPPA
jgi:hypothetical protein